MGRCCSATTGRRVECRDGRGRGAHRPPGARGRAYRVAARAVLLRRRGLGGGYLSDEELLDREQAQLAKDAAEEGVERARAHAMTRALASRRPPKARGAGSSRLPTSSMRG